MERLAGHCPTCDTPLVSLLVAPPVPDFWVRVTAADNVWRYSGVRPAGREEPSDLAYRCAGCLARFRVVVPAT